MDRRKSATTRFAGNPVAVWRRRCGGWTGGRCGWPEAMPQHARPCRCSKLRRCGFFRDPRGVCRATGRRVRRMVTGAFFCERWGGRRKTENLKFWEAESAAAGTAWQFFRISVSQVFRFAGAARSWASFAYAEAEVSKCDCSIDLDQQASNEAYAALLPTLSLAASSHTE
jgi:hypothetical protein